MPETKILVIDQDALNQEGMDSLTNQGWTIIRKRMGREVIPYMTGLQRLADPFDTPVSTALRTPLKEGQSREISTTSLPETGHTRPVRFAGGRTFSHVCHGSPYPELPWQFHMPVGVGVSVTMTFCWYCLTLFVHESSREVYLAWARESAP